MGCGCKKIFCSTKRCKCVKVGKKCSSECGCDQNICENREKNEEEKVDEVLGNEIEKNEVQTDEIKDEAQVENLTWEDMESKCLEDLELLRKIIKKKKSSGTVPTELELCRATYRKEMETLMQKMEKVNMNMNNENECAILADNEWEEFARKLIPCQVCCRKFQPDRVQLHENICKRRTHTL